MEILKIIGIFIGALGAIIGFIAISEFCINWLFCKLGLD